VEYFSLIFLHVLFSIFWAGGAIAVGFFIIPAVIEAGPGGGAVMAGVVKRKFPLVMTTVATVVLLTGLRLYMIRFTPAWLGTGEGIVLTLGALAAIGAFALGVFVQRPVAMRLSALAGAIAASGAPPTAAQAGELQALRLRLGKIGRLTAWHLLAAAVLMASHRLVAVL
jgi:hypothetical protein